MPEPLWTAPLGRFSDPIPDSLSHEALAALESGRVLYFPTLPFTLSDDERALQSVECLDRRAKNVSFDPTTGSLKGTSLGEPARTTLTQLLTRYHTETLGWLKRLLPPYAPALYGARTSYRPAEMANRALSPRKDDRRLHVDAFPSRPNQGERILRVFSNVNSQGAPRRWRLGEPFEACATHFLPRLRRPWPGEAFVLDALGITRGRRSLYDHHMLMLHNAMKLDERYQKAAWQQEVLFAAGSTWVVYSDQALHAAMGGQFMLEQTVHLPVAAMQHPQWSPLQVLERLQARA